MKRLNFAKHLALMMLSDEKTTTWRVDDEKNISVGDIVICTYKDENHLFVEFAKIEVNDVREKEFGGIDDRDLAGHEKFTTKKEMYEWYSDAYKKEISPETTLKVIRFDILEKYI